MMSKKQPKNMKSVKKLTMQKGAGLSNNEIKSRTCGVCNSVYDSPSGANQCEQAHRDEE